MKLTEAQVMMLLRRIEDMAFDGKVSLEESIDLFEAASDLGGGDAVVMACVDSGWDLADKTRN